MTSCARNSLEQTERDLKKYENTKEQLHYFGVISMSIDRERDQKSQTILCGTVPVNKNFAVAMIVPMTSIVCSLDGHYGMYIFAARSSPNHYSCFA